MARKVSSGWMVLCCLIVALESAALCQGHSSEDSLQDCSQDDGITLLYQKLEGALINSPKALFQLKKTFFSVKGTDIQEVEIVYFRVCVNAGDIEHLKGSGKSTNSSNTSTHCWNFKWSASALLSFIIVDQLMAIDVAYVNMIYSQMQGSLEYHKANITLKIDLLPCMYMPSETDIKEVLVHLFSWVSKHPCVYSFFFFYKETKDKKTRNIVSKSDLSMMT